MENYKHPNMSVLQALNEFENTAITNFFGNQDIFKWLNNLDENYSSSMEYQININGVLCNIGDELRSTPILNIAAKRIKALNWENGYKNKLRYDYGNILFCLVKLETQYSDEFEAENKFKNLLEPNKFTEAREQFAEIPASDENYLSAATNFATILGTLGRTTEAIECFNRLLRINPKFGMALANKAEQLIFYFNLSPEKSLRLIKIARTLYHQALLDPEIDQIGGSLARVHFGKKIKALDIFLDEKNPIADEKSNSPKISKYKEFCLSKNLFLNYDFGHHYDDLSLIDSLAPPFIEYFDEKVGPYSTHMSESIYFSLHTFNQILEAYVTARHQYYYSTTKKFTVLDKDIYFCYTFDQTKHGHEYGLLKIILGCLYNSLDKIGHLIFYYFLRRNNPDQKIYFTDLLNEEVKTLIESKKNHQLLALRSLALDFENGHQYNRLNKIRNRITHSFLNINPFETYRENKEENEISFEITEDELRGTIEELFLIVKSALLYTVNAIRLDSNKELGGARGITREIVKETNIFF